LNKFSLIQDNPSYIDVLFLYNEEAEEAYEEYKEIIKLKSFQEKREKYLEVGQVFKNYTLSIPQKYCRSFVEENGLLILPREGIDQYYDEDTGFIRNDTDTYMIF
jgi:CRISPR-associated endonuclease/helicase Cas3